MPCIFHIHGGGYVAGSAARMQPIHRKLCADLGCVIVSIDYRLDVSRRAQRDSVDALRRVLSP